jgi:hypothetical protein
LVLVTAIDAHDGEDRAKEKRALLLFLMITLGVLGAAAGLAWWWFTNREPF